MSGDIWPWGRSARVKVTIIDIASPQWLAFVAGHPSATAFHHPSWAQFLGECYAYSAFAVAVVDGAGQLRAGMPMLEVRSWLTGPRWVSLPFTDNCPVLYHDVAEMHALVAYLAGQCQKGRVPRVEIRGPTARCAMVREGRPYVGHRLALTADVEGLFRTLDRGIRKKTRQARERGVRIQWCTTEEEMLAFYGLLVHTRSRLGVPAQPKRFFQLLWRRVLKQGLGFLLLAYAGGRPIAGDVFLHYGRHLTAKYNASDPAYWGLRANNLLYWTAIEWGCRRGFRSFDFGRSDLDNISLRDYKSRWGAAEEPLVYSTIGGRELQRVRRPPGALRALIQHSHPLLSRAVGELFYRHSA